MKATHRLAPALCALLFALPLLGQSLRGVPVFGDDFNATGLFIENWEPSKLTVSEGGRAIIPTGNSMRLRRVPEGNFAFSADVAVREPEERTGHGGIILDGIHFMLNPGGSANTAYRVPGETRSRGNARPISGFAFGKPYRLRVSREVLGDMFKYTYTVDGDPVDSFVVKMPADARIQFYGYRLTIEVDNFQLERLAEGDGSNNLAVNSSFEHLQEGRPNYIRPGLGGELSFEGKWTDFLDFFAIDTTEKVDGAQSVRMTVGEAPLAPTRNGVSTFNVNVVARTPVTFTIHLKASETNFPVTMNIWELHHRNHSKEIVVSREWERHSFTIEAPERAIVRCGVGFSRPGTLWADAIQVEIGTEATPYRPSSLDADKFAPAVEEELEIPDDIVLKTMPRAPVIDGTIEPLWFEHAAKTDAFHLRGWEKPAHRTEAFLACDRDNLYLAVRAHVPDPAKVSASEHDRDNLRVHVDECMELLIDSTLSRRRYHHLAMNAVGSKTDMGEGRLIAWSGDWEGMARVHAGAKAIDYEFKIPLRLFTNVNLSRRWGLNIGRNDTAAGNVVSLIRTREPNFHLPAIYPAVVFPDGVVDRYRAGVSDLQLVADGDAKRAVTGTIDNQSGNVIDARIQIVDRASGKLVGGRQATLGAGGTRFEVPVDVAADVATLDADVRVVADGQTYLAETRRIALARKLEAYTRYNYYMDEPAAVLVGSLNLPDAERLVGQIAVAGKAFDVRMAPEFALDVPLAGIEPGEHPITLTVLDGKDELASATTTLVKRPFKKGATQIDRQRRCLVVDGKPRLLVAPFFGVPRGVKPEDRDRAARNLLRRHVEAGYRDLLIGAVDDPPVAALAQTLFDLCAERGIKVLYWPFQSWNRREEVTPEQRLQSIVSDDIVGWLVVDEPELYAKSEEVEPFLESYRAASPYTPVFMNNTKIGIPGRFANLKTDILMLDDYLTNREGRKVVEMIHETDVMWEAGREERKPVFYFLAGENLHNHYREPTHAEQIAQSYGVVLAGCRGISYFLSLATYPEHYRALVEVNRELLALEDAILSLEPTPPAMIASPLIRSITRRLGDRLYVIALNADNGQAVEAEIALPASARAAASAEVKFEDRKAAVEDGRIRDAFKPLERHVYVVDLDRIPAAPSN
ncbi:MAG: hypothetical protein ACOX9C_02280 [Kiritimatiellia bacterium]|jgi:hypothetical protein